MDTILIFILVVIIILFGLANLAFLKANSLSIKKLKKYVFYTILGIALVGFMIGFIFIHELTLPDKILYLFIGVIMNPLLIIFPLWHMTKKISPSVSNILSKTLLIVYNIIFLVGLVGMTSPANTWGNSGLLSGIAFVVWSLPNILLATIMTNNFRFTGIIKLALGILTLLIIVFTTRKSEYNGDFEYSFRTMAFLTCIYCSFEGYLFIAKHKVNLKNKHLI